MVAETGSLAAEAGIRSRDGVAPTACWVTAAPTGCKVEPDPITSTGGPVEIDAGAVGAETPNGAASSRIPALQDRRFSFPPLLGFSLVEAERVDFL